MKINSTRRRNTLLFLMQIIALNVLLGVFPLTFSYALGARGERARHAEAGFHYNSLSVNTPMSSGGTFRAIVSFQGVQVSGVVKDDAGTAIPGVNVIEKGTTNGTTTDVDGKYSLMVNGENTVLVFSFIGYTTQEISVNGRSSIDVGMTADTQTLDEIVVVGYGE